MGKTKALTEPQLNNMVGKFFTIFARASQVETNRENIDTELINLSNDIQQQLYIDVDEIVVPNYNILDTIFPTEA